jgi:hypothetical protein
MSKFVQQENQRLLWNVSQKLPNIRHVFPEMVQQERWFKEVIQHFYERRKHASLTRRDLEELNKEVIQYMIDDVASRLSAPPRPLLKDHTRTHAKNVTFGPEPVGAAPFVPITPRPQTIIGEPRLASTNLLEERQREYDNMLKREVPAEPNFREMEKDTVIENMDELLQQQLRERELLYLPGAQGPPDPKIVVPKKPAASRTLKIQEDLNEVISMETVFEPPPAPVHDPAPLLMDLLLEIRNELRELRNLYNTSANVSTNVAVKAEEMTAEEKTETPEE